MYIFIDTMEPLIIPVDENTPSVKLNAEQQIFIIEGESIPESAHKFYKPILEWLRVYEKVLHEQKRIFEDNRRMTFQFKYDYFNSGSAKYIYEIFSILDKMAMNNLRVRIKWFYSKEDSDMKQAGEELKKMVTKLEVKLLETESTFKKK